MTNCYMHRYLGDMANTYVFTKNLAEHVIQDYSNEVPVVIFRPSIGNMINIEYQK